MKWRYLAWVVVVLAALGFAAVMIPGSPVSLQNTLGEPVAEGRKLRDWVADLDSPDKDKRLQAVAAINSIAPQAGRTAKRLGELMTTDPDPQVRERAGNVLARLAVNAKPALDSLIKGLSDDSVGVRFYSALTLLALKGDARPAVPALLAAMDAPRNDVGTGTNQTIQGVAAAALGVASVGTADAVPALTAVVASNRPEPLRFNAIRALGLIGEPARSAIPTLTPLLKSDDFNMRDQVTNALRDLGQTLPDVPRPNPNQKADGTTEFGGGQPPAKGAPRTGPGG